jgi:hypothetical protein
VAYSGSRRIVARLLAASWSYSSQRSAIRKKRLVYSACYRARSSSARRGVRVAKATGSVLSFGRTALCALALTILFAGGVSAQSSAALPFYVSDRFQQVALKIVEQVAVESIKSACPKDQPFCDAMVQNLGDAANAAFAKDQAKTKVALTQFFVSSSTAALMESTIGDLVRTEPIQAARTTALQSLVKCLNTLVNGKQSKDVCENLTAVAAQIEAAICEKPVCPEGEQVKAAIERHHLDGGVIARALRIVARNRGRTDLEMYLTNLAAFLDQHPEDGVFEAAYAFLTATRTDFAEASFLDEDYGNYRPFASDANAALVAALQRCKLDAALIDAWRSPAALGASYRGDLILGRAPDTAPLTGLLDADLKTCAAADIQTIQTVQPGARTLLGQLRAINALHQFAIAGLLAATAIDFARSGNQPALDEHIRRTVLFALAQLVAHASNMRALAGEAAGAKVTGATVLRANDVLRTCEFQRLSILEQLPVIVDSAASPQCTGLNGSTPETLSAGAFTDLGESTRDDVVAALTEFAYGLKAARPEDYPQVLSAWITVKLASKGQDGKIKLSSDGQALVRILSRIQVSPADAGARANLQKLVKTVAEDPALAADKVKSAHGVNEPDLGPVLAWTPDQVAALKAVPEAQRSKGPARALALFDEPTLKDFLQGSGGLLGLAIPHKVRAVQATATQGQRALQFYQQAKGIAELVAPDLEAAATKSGIDVDLIMKGIAAGLNEQAPIARKLLLQASTEFLESQVIGYTTRLLGPKAEKCDTKEDGTWRFIWKGFEGVCAVKVLIEGAYMPIAEFVWADDFTFTADSAAALSNKSYQSLIASPALGQTLILFNVGLGMNIVVGRSGHAFSADPDHPERGGFVALTLLDKLGLNLLKYRSAKYQFEAGAFVGGFLDALVRTAADTPDKYWLAGVTAGWTRMGGLDFGLQVHAAAALPFSFHSDPRPAIGVAMVVPFSYVFE